MELFNFRYSILFNHNLAFCLNWFNSILYKSKCMFCFTLLSTIVARRREYKKILANIVIAIDILLNHNLG